MSAKLCPKIILKGTRLMLKTEIALKLNEHPHRQRRELHRRLDGRDRGIWATWAIRPM